MNCHALLFNQFQLADTKSIDILIGQLIIFN